MRTNKTVPLTNLNKYSYNNKSEIKLNINNSREKSMTEYVSVIYVCISCTWWSGRLQYNSRFVGVGRAVTKKLS